MQRNSLVESNKFCFNFKITVNYILYAFVIFVLKTHNQYIFIRLHQC